MDKILITIIILLSFLFIPFNSILSNENNTLTYFKLNSENVEFYFTDSITGLSSISDIQLNINDIGLIVFSSGTICCYYLSGKIPIESQCMITTMIYFNC